MEVDTVLSDFESSDFGEMVRNDVKVLPVYQVYTKHKNSLTSKPMVKQWSVIF